MKVLLLSNTGDGLGLLLRLKEEGNEVRAWIRENRARKNYDGLIQKVTRWQEYLSKDTLVLFDSTGGGSVADRLQGQGYRTFGGSVFADNLEQDRVMALTLMQEVGIQIPKMEQFNSWEAGIAFIKANPQRWVFKPTEELEKTLGSYVPFDAEDQIGMLEYLSEQKDPKPTFILQEFIEGLAISTEGWFNGKEFLPPFNHTFERKRHMNNDLGSDIGGCAGNVVWATSDGLTEQGIARLADTLRQHNYIGPIDLNMIISGEELYGLELTPRFGYDALPSFLELYEGEVGKLISDMTQGEGEMRLKTGFASALRITVPPYPTEDAKAPENLLVRGFEREDRKHIYFYDIMLDEKNRPVTSGGYGVVATLTGHGSTIEESFQVPEVMADRAKIPDKQYRTDLVQELVSDYQKLHSPVEGEGSDSGVEPA